MANRTVYGRTHSENGWPMVDQGSCRWVRIPGAEHVSLQIREGQPEVILRAFAADFNTYVEPLRDADSACWTATNSVASSCHLSGTAMDLNWNGADGKTFRFQIPEERAYPPPKNRAVRELLDFYEGLVFCGGDWSIRDWMHFQMGGNTYNNPRTADFIKRKIRPDGFSTFRRSSTAPPPKPTQPPELSRTDGYALRIINEGKRRGITPRGIQIALATAIVESNIKVYANEKLPKSMALPHDAVGRDGLSVGIFQQQVKDTGNGWWWGDETTCMGVESSAGLFYDRLARIDYNGPGSPGSYAQAIQRSAYPSRYDEHMGEAVALYNKLSPTTNATDPQGDDELSAEAERKIDVIYRELTQLLPSRSPLRYLDQATRHPKGVDTLAGMVLNIDGMQHFEHIRALAGYGHPETLTHLRELAAADPVKHPDRQDDRLLAQAILADVTSKPTAAAPVVRAAEPTPPVDDGQLAAAREENARLRAQLESALAKNAYSEAKPSDEPPPVLPVAPAEYYMSGHSTGDVIGRLYDSLEALRLADALPIESRAPLAALISVLSTKNGAQV